MGAYTQAYQILQGMSNRDAAWYYYNAIACYGLGQIAQALQSAQTACEMDPSNQQYRQLYAQLSSGRNQYQQMRSPFGGNPSSLCCTCLILNMCCGGSRFLPLYCCC